MQCMLHCGIAAWGIYKVISGKLKMKVSQAGVKDRSSCDEAQSGEPIWLYITAQFLLKAAQHIMVKLCKIRNEQMENLTFMTCVCMFSLDHCAENNSSINKAWNCGARAESVVESLADVGTCLARKKCIYLKLRNAARHILIHYTSMACIQPRICITTGAVHEIQKSKTSQDFLQDFTNLKSAIKFGCFSSVCWPAVSLSWGIPHSLSPQNATTT